MRGHVLAILPRGLGSQFALLPPDNATGNFTKVVQRVAVKIAIDDAGWACRPTASTRDVRRGHGRHGAGERAPT